MVLNEKYHSTEKAAPFPAPSEGDRNFGNENVALQCLVLYDEDKVERRRNEDGTRTTVYPWIPHPTNANRLKTDEAIRSINRGGCNIVERKAHKGVQKAHPRIIWKHMQHVVIAIQIL